MHKRMEAGVKGYAALVPLVQRERRSPPASRAGVQPRELPPHAGDSGDNCRVVVDNASREADQDRCQGRQPRPVRCVSDGGGHDAAQTIRCDNAENRCFASAADGDNNMTPVFRLHRKTTRELRPHADIKGLCSGRRTKSRPISCRGNQDGRQGTQKPPESAGHDSKRTAIWRIPVTKGNVGLNRARAGARVG
jgi:hypothetical protein